MIVIEKLREKEVSEMLPSEYVQWVNEKGVAYLKDNRHILIYEQKQEFPESIPTIELVDVIDKVNKVILSKEARIKIKGYEVYSPSEKNSNTSKLLVKELATLVIEKYDVRKIYEDAISNKNDFENLIVKDKSILKYLDSVRLYTMISNSSIETIEDMVSLALGNILNMRNTSNFMDLNMIELLNFITNKDFRLSICTEIFKNIEDEIMECMQSWIPFYVLSITIKPLQDCVRKIRLMEQSSKTSIIYINTQGKKHRKAIYKHGISSFFTTIDEKLAILNWTHEVIPFETVKEILIDDEVIYRK